MLLELEAQMSNIRFRYFNWTVNPINGLKTGNRNRTIERQYGDGRPTFWMMIMNTFGESAMPIEIAGNGHYPVFARMN